jgi:hypothetical protein
MLILDSSVPLAAIRVGGIAMIAVGTGLLLASAKAGPGIAQAIVNPPDVITDRRPPDAELLQSVALYGRAVRAVLVFASLLLIVCGLIVVTGIAHDG